MQLYRAAVLQPLLYSQLIILYTCKISKRKLFYVCTGVDFHECFILTEKISFQRNLKVCNQFHDIHPVVSSQLYTYTLLWLTQQIITLFQRYRILCYI